MHYTLAPLTPALRPLFGELLQIRLPGGPYLLPATLQPTLVCAANGGLSVADGAGGWRAMPRAFLAGATTGIHRVKAEPGTDMLLLAIRPGQLPRLFGPSAGSLLDRNVALDDLLPTAQVDALHDGLLAPRRTAHRQEALEKQLLRCHAAHAHRRPDMHLPADWLFRPLADIADAFALSERQFERRFRSSTGQSLRAFRQQFRWSCLVREVVFGQLEAPSWVDAACAGGYADQSHLHRDFRRYTGHTPGELGKRLGADDPELWPYHLTAAEIGRLFASAPGG
jgi:AraC-like DNA-binding protein